jgi:hypothetical protein
MHTGANMGANMTEPFSSDLAIARAYFDRFAMAFATFDGAQVAGLFATPGVALRRDGSLIALTTRDDVVRYYQAALERYRRDGCQSCRWSQLTVTPMGRRSLLATVTWDLLREDGTILTRWRQSYSLCHTDDDTPSAFASAMHAE